MQCRNSLQGRPAEPEERRALGQAGGHHQRAEDCLGGQRPETQQEGWKGNSSQLDFPWKEDFSVYIIHSK